MYFDYFDLAFQGDTNYRVCTRCVMDTTVPGITYDRAGECNFCKLHDKLDAQFPLDENGVTKKIAMLDEIKKRGRNRKYDCVLGISGGRDSTYTLWLAVKEWGLRPLAVHFNDGFGNPVAGENMQRATNALGVELRTVTSDWRESKDIKVALLKAGVPDLEVGTDIGIASALYGMATKEGVNSIIIGQSFRTEGIAPLSWNYLDGLYLRSIQSRYGKIRLRKWRPDDPGFRLGVGQILYYAVLRRIKTYPLLYLTNYVRSEVDEIIVSELDWKYPGAHYFDDLYQSLMFYVHRTKFKFDRRVYNYSALIREGQLNRDEVFESLKEPYRIEDAKVIDLCIKRLGLTRHEFDEILAGPAMNFRDYPNVYNLIRRSKWLIRALCATNILPGSVYDKYFNCGM